ncbi:MAG TPA: AsmA-like C-terminal region-containing protein, partial [Rudaea sp.]|nr:AsmA-like C-terminal region-containing protein [Rudaea sp.]
DSGGRPLIDASAIVEHAEVPASHLFWPINTMPPAAVSWLDRGLDSGHVVGGRAVIRGDLTDWPFRNFSGRFEARAEVDDLSLKYLPDWPAAEHMRLTADFVNTSLHVNVDSAQLKGNRLNHASADIGDLGEPLLELEADAQGAGADLLTLLKATPIGQRFGVQLLGVDVGGQGKANFHVHLPIKHAEQLALTGTVLLSDADLVDAKYALRLNRANGKLRFSQAGFVADDLAVMMEGQPASFGLAVGAFTADPHHEVEATLSASLPGTFVLAYAPALSAYADYVEGSANWSVAFSADGGTSNSQHLLLTSDLRGIALTLPAPLNKAAGAVLPLRLSLGLPFSGGSVDLQVGDLLRMHGRLPAGSSPFSARVTLGGDTEEAVPRSGMTIGGKTSSLDLSGWLDFATSGRSDDGNGTVLNSIDLHADSMSAYGRDFGPTRFTLGRAADGLDMGFTGTGVEGTLHVPATDLRKHGVTAQFARLYWPELNDPDTGSVTSGENPASVPPLHIHISDFRLGDKNFGESVVETYPIAGGSHFEQVSTHSSNIEMRAHGDWTGRPGSDTSTFSIEMSAHNIGRMLDAFGYAGVIDGGATVAHIEGSWSGPPSSFALTRLDGTLKTSIKKGRIPDADPGSARVLGLFNLAAIPRRLAFDFGDLFKTGFSFDSIDGTFTLKDGNAHTDDLKVLSPTADMLLKGRMGLKDKDWDQTIQVTPHVGGTLAIGGALIAGPVGAAAGALIQGVFNKQINSVARAEYKVSGSWDNPKVTVIKKETVKSKPDAGSDKIKGNPHPAKNTDAQKEPERGLR